jgi:hypothetical protein
MATSPIVSDLRTTLGGDRVGMRLQHDELPRDAVYAAAFSFIDRCYVRLDRVDGDISIELRAKSAGSAGAPGAFDAEAVAAELRSELYAHAFRVQLAERGNDFSAAIVTAAVGAPASAAGAEPDPIADLAAAPFDDPLGIALSWEEKHATKEEGSAAPSAATKAETEPQALGEGEHAK